MAKLVTGGSVDTNGARVSEIVAVKSGAPVITVIAETSTNLGSMNLQASADGTTWRDIPNSVFASDGVVLNLVLSPNVYVRVGNVGTYADDVDAV